MDNSELNTSQLKYFDNYMNSFLDKDKELLIQYFKEFNRYCLINEEDKKKIENDLKRAIIFYINNKKSLKDALEILDLKYLGDFYSNISKQKFELDDSAKILSLTTSYNFTTIFRLSVYLKKDVVPEILQMALNCTIKRFPSFATKFKKGFFWHYFEISKKRYYIEEEKNMPCQPINFRDKNAQLFRVLYFKNRISVEIFHVLTDGTGGLEFVKSLLSEYLRLLGNEIVLDETIIDVNSNVEQEELEDAFKKIPSTNSKVSSIIDKQVFQFDDKLSQNRPCGVIHFNLDAEKLKLTAKKYNATVTEYFLSLMFISSNCINKKNNNDYSILVPVNIRKYFPTKTIRNFTIFFMIRLPSSKTIDTFYQVKNVREKMEELNNQEAIIQSVSAMRKMINFFKYIPLDMKRTGAKLIYSIIGRKTSSTVLSNIGVVKLPKSISKNIVSMDAFMNTAISNSHLCSIITVNNVATFSITKLIKSSKFEEKMYELLCNDGLIPVVEGSELYED